MESLYIKKADIGDIMTEVAEAAVRHPNLVTDITISYFCGTCLRVTVQQAERPYTILVRKEFRVINDIHDGIDVVDATITEALAELEKINDQEEEDNGSNS